MTKSNTNYLTLLLLCLGYFIDFYDLTIMGVSYNELIQEQFNITAVAQIQQTYLMISNFQTIGFLLARFSLEFSVIKSDALLQLK